MLAFARHFVLARVDLVLLPVVLAVAPPAIALRRGRRLVSPARRGDLAILMIAGAVAARLLEPTAGGKPFLHRGDGRGTGRCRRTAQLFARLVVEISGAVDGEPFPVGADLG